ncbi:MAG: hypothetical protein Q4D38_07860 [Planctomycetia bacterium]|nr:hypothetical protein [Planctomycetia bacterium]
MIFKKWFSSGEDQEQAKLREKKEQLEESIRQNTRKISEQEGLKVQYEQDFRELDAQVIAKKGEYERAVGASKAQLKNALILLMEKIDKKKNEYALILSNIKKYQELISAERQQLLSIETPDVETITATTDDLQEARYAHKEQKMAMDALKRISVVDEDPFGDIDLDARLAEYTAKESFGTLERPSEDVTTPTGQKTVEDFERLLKEYE